MNARLSLPLPAAAIPAKRAVPLLLLLLVAAMAAWAALAPLPPVPREAVYVIPSGTWARRMSGKDVEILPSEIHLTLGISDILVLTNRDEVPQIFGPTLLMPGQSLRLPFSVPSSYQFACSAHADGQMTIVVEPAPESPAARLLWRLSALWRSLRW